jgi:hypothetical protein
MNNAIRFKLFVMMVLEIAIWGAWQVQIFNYMPMLKFEGRQHVRHCVGGWDFFQQSVCRP